MDSFLVTWSLTSEVTPRYFQVQSLLTLEMFYESTRDAPHRPRPHETFLRISPDPRSLSVLPSILLHPVHPTLLSRPKSRGTGREDHWTYGRGETWSQRGR